MQRVLRHTILLTLVACTLLVKAQDLPRKGFFCNAPYGHSLLADVHPNFTRLDIAGFSNHTAYDYGQGGCSWRAAVFGIMGVEVPIWRGEFKENTFGLSFTMTASSTIWLDILEKTTAPVVNTDYRFGMPTLTFIHRLNKGFVKSYSIAVSPFKHESTHIGDELQIQHMEQGYPLRRVNVSNNYAELAFTLNEPEQRADACHTFRLSTAILLHPASGWYTVTPADGPIELLGATTAPLEVWLQYQYQTRATKGGLQGVVSAEIRNRALYGYSHDGRTLQDEQRVFTYNLFAGLRILAPNYDGIFSRFAVGVRAYHGNCPYGQFRNLAKYTQIGLSIIFQ